jgi:DNA-binding GntR family transcriptional regulator
MSYGYEFRADMPKHAQIADDLGTRIRNGEFEPRNPIPSDTRLMQEYGVARVTARKAVALLRERNYIRTVNGMGSFVRDPGDWPPETR